MELLGDQEAVILVGHGDRRAESGDTVEPPQRVLQERELIDQAEELLRVMRP